MNGESDTYEEGQPTGEPSPSTPDESVPSEADVKREVPGIPEDPGERSDDPVEHPDDAAGA